MLSDGTYTYEYDGEGNRTKRVAIATGTVTEYVWDYRNRLAQVISKDANGVITKNVGYAYDVNNQRIGKAIDGVVTERYVLDRNHISLVFNGDGTQTHRYLYGTEVDRVLADETATAMVWALADHQGTVRDLADGDGAIVNHHITYDSFGRVVGQTSSIHFRYGYTGREQDDETGLNYYRARYYDAAVSRFISEDPISFESGDTNFYRYVENDPLGGTDPSGLARIGFVSILGRATRTISFLDRRGSYHTVNHIQSAVNFFNSTGFIRMVGDETVALLQQSISRSPTASKTIGLPVPGLRLGDDAGHIIARELGGSGRDLNNLFAQKREGNNQYRVTPDMPSSAWRSFETEVATKITTPQFGEVKKMIDPARMR
jgi:RHS repeat-associated protein